MSKIRILGASFFGICFGLAPACTQTADCNNDGNCPSGQYCDSGLCRDVSTSSSGGHASSHIAASSGNNGSSGAATSSVAGSSGTSAASGTSSATSVGSGASSQMGGSSGGSGVSGASSMGPSSSQGSTSTSGGSASSSSLRASSSSAAPSSSQTGGAAHHLMFSTEVGPFHTGTPFGLGVRVEDAQGRLASGSVAVTLSIHHNANGATLSGTTTVNSVGGVATFTGLQLDKPGVGYRLQAQAAALAVLVSDRFDVGGGWHPASGQPWGLLTGLGQDLSQTGNVYAAGRFGMFYSGDGAVTWSQAVVPEPWTYEALVVAGDPNTPGQAWAGTTAGILKSTDFGRRWARPSAALNAFQVNALAVPRGAATTVYAGTSNGVYKSVDSGTSWTLQNTGLPDHNITGLVVDDQAANVLYAGSGRSTSPSEAGGNIYKSVDSGATWSEVHHAAAINREVMVMKGRHPSGQTSRVYVGRKSGAVATGGFLRSVDDGANWTEMTGISDFGGFGVMAMGVDPTVNQERVWATNMFWTYTANGFSTAPYWTSLAGAPFVPRDFLFDSQNGSTVYVAHYVDGVSKTTNAGQSFQRRADGITQTGPQANGVDTQVFMLGVGGGSPPALVAGTEPGGSGFAFVSFNLGASWERVVSPKVGSTNLFTGLFAVIPEPTGTGSWIGTTDGIFRTDDFVAYTAVGSVGDRIAAMAVDPSDPNRAYAGSDSGWFYTSVNGGQSWDVPTATVTGANIRRILVHPTQPTTILMTSDYRGIWKSTDRGAHWDQAHSGLAVGNPPTPIQNPDALAIWMDRSSPQTMVVSVPDNQGVGCLFRTVDGAVSWTQIPGAPPSVVHALEELANGDLVAGTENGVYRSTDRGSVWTLVAGSSGFEVDHLSTTAAAPNVIFGGTLDRGVYRFTP